MISGEKEKETGERLEEGELRTQVTLSKARKRESIVSKGAR